MQIDIEKNDRTNCVRTLNIRLKQYKLICWMRLKSELGLIKPLLEGCCVHRWDKKSLSYRDSPSLSGSSLLHRLELTHAHFNRELDETIDTVISVF